MTLFALLNIAAAGQIVVALLNLRLVRLLGWRDALNNSPPLLRQVFFVHSWFISITLTIFAVLTWRFSATMASGVLPMARWFAGAIAVFWLIRVVLQLAYYSAEHWRGRPAPTAIHIALLIGYGGFAAIYGFCCLGGST